jgi:hypothetical protein
MEYRGVEYTVVRDEHDNWQWSVSLGNPEKIKSGHTPSKGAAVLRVCPETSGRIAEFSEHEAD